MAPRLYARPSDQAGPKRPTRSWAMRAEELQELLHRARQRMVNAEARFDCYQSALGTNGGRTLEALRGEMIEATLACEALEARLDEAKRKAK